MSEIKRILDVVENIQSEITVMKVNDAEMRKDLNYHIEQTNILREEVKPIHSSHQQIIGVVKFLGLFSLCLSIIIGLAKLF